MGAKRGHVPERTCIGCARKATKPELTRLAVTPEGNIERDLRNRMSGRGAYVCNLECAKAAAKRRRFGRAFRREVRPEAVEALIATWENEVRSGGNETEAE